ncbi:MAG: hypothetical protein HZB38_10830 [Planctomycetes bacterium]|nr:hypothetical protein [Planctomycetota bacterium]
MESFSTRQVRFALAVFGLFCLSVFKSCREVNYWIAGETAEARITGQQLVQVSSRYRSSEQLRVDYQFVDAAGLKRQDSALLDPDDPHVPSGGTVSVEYLAGVYAPSRVAGTHEWTWPVLMFGMPIGAALWAIAYVKIQTARETIRRR